jgi:hypothetical protein
MKNKKVTTRFKAKQQYVNQLRALIDYAQSRGLNVVVTPR